MKFFCSTILAAILGSFAQINVSGAKLQQQPCLVVVKVTQLKNNKQLREFHCSLDDVDRQPNGLSTVKIDGLSKEELNKMVKVGSLVPGKTTMMEGTAEVTENKIVIPTGSKPNFSIVNQVSANVQNGGFTGEFDVLVVRMDALDIQTTLSGEELSDKVFGNGDDEWNLISGYDACSNGELVFEPFPDLVEDVVDGVLTIEYDENISLETAEEMEETIMLFVNDENELSPTYTVICLPPGLESSEEGINWEFYALQGGNVAVFNDDMCQYPSLLMNSFGIMFGLGPSANDLEDGEELDESCLMGKTYTDQGDEYPKKCFNGAKLWQLNWFPDNHLVFDPEDISTDVNIIGISDLPQETNLKVVAKISNEGVDYYVYFNVVREITQHTGTGPDKVMIVQTASDEIESLVIAALGVGESYVIEDYLVEGQVATVLVNAINLTSSPPVADVTIFVGYITESPSLSPSSSPSESQVPSKTPSALPSMNPSSAPSNVPSLVPSTSPTESSAPSELPSSVPSTSLNPSSIPSATPSTSSNPSITPSAVPSKSSNPSSIPSATPSLSKSPTVVPVTNSPVTTESSAPSGIPSSVPSTSLNPSSIPSATPSTSSKPSSTPSSVPSKSPSALQCTTLLDSFSWEDGITPFIDGGNDARRYRGYASDGDYSLRLRDDRYMASSVYLPATYLSSYTHFKVSFSYITKRMDDVGEDGLFLEGNPTVSFGTGEWEQFGSWVYGVDFENDERNSVTTDLIDKSSYGTGPFVLRFRGHSSNNLERFFLDEMTVIGCV